MKAVCFPIHGFPVLGLHRPGYWPRSFLAIGGTTEVQAYLGWRAFGSGGRLEPRLLLLVVPARKESGHRVSQDQYWAPTVSPLRGASVIWGCPQGSAGLHVRKPKAWDFVWFHSNHSPNRGVQAVPLLLPF